MRMVASKYGFEFFEHTFLLKVFLAICSQAMNFIID